MIFFNGLSGHVFSTSEKEHQSLQQKFSDLVSFKIQYSSVFEKFKEWGFIVDRQKDELDTIRLRNRLEVFSDRTYHLVINPTLECNFNCWYCYEKHPKGYMSESTMDLVKKHMQWMVDNEKIDGLNISWFGGELLMYFNKIVYPISQYAKELTNKHQLKFFNTATTNAYLINPEMVNRFLEINLDFFQITIDGDEKRHDTIRNANGQPTFRRIMDNINLLCEKIPAAHITLRVNYDNETLEKCDLENVLSLIPLSYRKQISVNLQRVWQTFSGNASEYDKRVYWQKMSEQLGYRQCYISNVFTVNRGHVCYVDRYYHTEINYDGKIYRCTARDYSDRYVRGILKDSGKIEWNPDMLAQQYGKATFENKMCITCKHLPICNGPCSQKMIETPPEEFGHICALKNAEITPESFITDLYEKKMKNLKELSEQRLENI
jgi:uncharacterized protein